MKDNRTRFLPNWNDRKDVVSFVVTWSLGLLLVGLVAYLAWAGGPR